MYWRIYLPLAASLIIVFILFDWGGVQISESWQEKDTLHFDETISALYLRLKDGNEDPLDILEDVSAGDDLFFYVQPYTSEEFGEGFLNDLKDNYQVVIDDYTQLLMAYILLPNGQDIAIIEAPMTLTGDLGWILLLATCLLSSGAVIYMVTTSYRKKLHSIHLQATPFLDPSHKVSLNEEHNLLAIARALQTAQRQLHQAKTEFSKDYDGLRDLLHAVAHEFRSPMARISFALDMASSENSEADVPTLYKDMESALAELNELVREVLNYSRLEHPDHSVELAQVNMNEVIEEINQSQSDLNSNIEFTKTLDQETLLAQGDERLLKRAIVNLVRNAGRFAEHQVSTKFTVSETEFSIIVEDDGPGIPPGKRERIFEPFTRLDPSRSRDSGGIGLGLAIVKRIIQLHGGQVQVSDSSLGGARFLMRWPR